MRDGRFDEIQHALRDDGLDAWLFCDFRVSDPIGRRILGLGEGLAARRIYRSWPELHDNAANVDGFETPDTRRIMPGTCFSIEPGIYLPGGIGVRSELNVFVDDGETTVTGQPVQEAVIAILADAVERTA